MRIPIFIWAIAAAIGVFMAFQWYQQQSVRTALEQQRLIDQLQRKNDDKWWLTVPGIATDVIKNLSNIFTNEPRNNYADDF